MGLIRGLRKQAGILAIVAMFTSSLTNCKATVNNAAKSSDIKKDNDSLQVIMKIKKGYQKIDEMTKKATRKIEEGGVLGDLEEFDKGIKLLDSAYKDFQDIENEIKKLNYSLFADSEEMEKTMKPEEVLRILFNLQIEINSIILNVKNLKAIIKKNMEEMREKIKKAPKIRTKSGYA